MRLHSPRILLRRFSGRPNVLGNTPCPTNKDPAMLYALLAYHVEADVMSWTPQEDAAVMAGLREAHGRIRRNGQLGPAARLGTTASARTLRGPGKGTVIDGPFA